MPYRLQVNGVDTEVQLLARRPQLQVRIGPAVYAAAGARGPGERFALALDGVPYHGWRCTVGDDVYVRVNGRTYVVRRLRHEPQRAAATAQEELRASMPGVVVAVHCESGQAVAAGDRLLTLESMKLQMTLVASHEATVAQIHVAPEAVFERGALLVSFARQETQNP